MEELDKRIVENIKVAVTLRAARAAIGWNQQELADKLGVAKSTVARIETLESEASARVYLRALELFEEGGVTVTRQSGGEVTVHVASAALEEAARRLADEHLRRADRKKTATKRSSSPDRTD